MEQQWIFQANPQRYDIDAALQKLSEIAWRVPQFTGELQAGDVVAIWRAGAEAGLVGVGRVISNPTAQKPGTAEQPFVTGDEDSIGLTTRVVIRVRPCDLVPKDQVAALEPMHEHPIIKAPMGSVFRLSADQWQALAKLLPDPPPPPTSVPEDALPNPFAWDQRRKSIFALPGGYDNLLDSLRRILSFVEDHRPERDDSASWMHQEFGIPESRAVRILGFLQSVSLIRAEAGRLELTRYGTKWLEESAPLVLVALLHSRVQFIGEMLASLQEPRTSQELLDVANDQYATGWTTRAQIDRRRGWLQSAGAIEIDDQGRLQLTERGRSFLDQLELSAPVEATEIRSKETAAKAQHSERWPTVAISGAAATEEPPSSDAQVAERLAKRLLEAARDATDPDAFEQAIANCFDFLGFHSEWLGGAGKTDVFLKAELGAQDRYAVIVDAKTTSRDAVRDGQIDWVTLQEHQEKYQADHAAIIGPAFQGDRLAERAKSYGVAVIEAAELAGLCRQHARVPLGLDAYRALFQLGELSGADAVADHAEESERWLDLAAQIYHLVEQLQGEEGALSARDLYWNLRGSVIAGPEGFTDEEIDVVLETFSAQPVAILRRTESGFSSIGSQTTAARRLRRLSELLDGVSNATPPVDEHAGSPHATPTTAPEELSPSSEEGYPARSHTATSADFSAMPKKKRSVFDAGIQPEGASLREIAGRMDCTTGNIRQHLAQIRADYGYEYRTKGDRFWITHPGGDDPGKPLSPRTADSPDSAKVGEYREALKRQHTKASKNVRWRPVKK